MYWFVSKFINKLAYAFRLFQLLLLIYLAIDVIYYVLVLGRFVIATWLDPFYSLPVGAVHVIAEQMNWNIGEKFPMLHPDVFFSMVLLFVILLLSNFFFIVIETIEKKFVERSYDKGEKDYE